MKTLISKWTIVSLLLCIVLFTTQLSARTKEAAPKLTNLVLSTDPKSVSPATCLQLLLDETVTVYAVGVDDKGKVFPLPKDSVVSWSGGDVLEVKPTGSHSATVKLAKPLKAAVSSVSANLSYDGKSFSGSTSVSQKMKELPKSFIVVFLKDPTKDKIMDIEKMKVGESITVYLRGMSSDMATMGEIFTLPLDANISWKAVPYPPIGAEIKITEIGCHSAKIDIVKPPKMEGIASSIKVEVDLKDGTKREAAFAIEVVK